MAYYLKKTNKPKGLYLQIYFSYRNKDIKQTVSKSYRAVGYYQDLISQGIVDPIDYCNKEIKILNEKFHLEKDRAKQKLIGDSPEKFLGYFFLKNIYDGLHVSNHLDKLQSSRKFKFSINDIVESLIYARHVMPCSKRKTFYDVIPKLYNQYNYSYDQMIEGLEFIGSNYEKLVEIFNTQVNRKYKCDNSISYFDCTNFYFEADFCDGFREKGPSKENRKDPIVGMGLLLDANQIPIGMKMYPGNQSEKPILPQIITNLKNKNNIKGRTILVADKGLNCARNIYEAKKNNDGYLFSKSVKQLSEVERTWVILDNGFTDIIDEKGNIKYRIKECIDNFEYRFKQDNKIVKFQVKEKRVVTYNPKLAKKQIIEINKMITKAKSMMFCQAKRSEYGECSKYVNFISINKQGKETDEKVKAIINEKAIEKDIKCAGYNMIITSEIKETPEAIYNIYHNLWRIEETFKVMKSYLDGRPVFVRKRECIYGHFLICYLSVLLLRILQFHCFENKYNTELLEDFIKKYKIVHLENGNYINLTQTSEFLRTITDELKLPITNYNLNDKQIKKMLEHRF